MLNALKYSRKCFVRYIKNSMHPWVTKQWRKVMVDGRAHCMVVSCVCMLNCHCQVLEKTPIRELSFIATRLWERLEAHASAKLRIRSIPSKNPLFNGDDVKDGESHIVFNKKSSVPSFFQLRKFKKKFEDFFFFNGSLLFLIYLLEQYVS